MSLKTSYRFIAPFYNAFVDRATRHARQQSLARLPQKKILQQNLAQQTSPQENSAEVLLNGVGTGLDFPYLPPQHAYTALDITAAMLAQAQRKAHALNIHASPHLNTRHHLEIQWLRGDSMSLPFVANRFDYVILHLIVAVVPHPALCLSEASRVLKPGGRILLFDKFLRTGEHAWLRRALTPLVGQLATRLDVVFEDLLPAAPDLQVISDEPILAQGWFRLIELQKNFN